MEKNQPRNYSCLCCPACRINTNQSPRDKELFHLKSEKNSKVNKPIEELTEECPLKKDQSSECRLSDNRRLRILLICLVILLLTLIGSFVLLINFLSLQPPLLATPTNTNTIAKPHGAVATDYANCSHIGTTLLRQGGNAVDASIGAAICMSVVAPHKTGLGGGGRIMIYSHKSRTNPLLIDFTNNTKDGIFATAKVRIPAFLRGLEFAQSLRGNLPWQRVVEPSVKIARDGFLVTEDLANEIARSVEHGMIWGHLRSGEILQLPILADTLETVARFGCDSFYNGSLSEKVLRDAVVKLELLHQLSSYEPRVSLSEKTIFHNHTIYLPPNANIFRSCIEELERLRILPSNSSSLEARTIVALSLIRSVAKNAEILKNLERERYSNIVAVDSRGNYVSIVTGLSTPLGLSHMTGAGFLLDGVDEDNSLDSLTPIIFHDERSICGLRGVFGTDDPTLASQILYNFILRSFNVSTCIEHPRFYVFSDGIATENDARYFMDPNLRAQLDSLVPKSHKNANETSKSVNAITKYKEVLSSHSDGRGDGRASRF